MLIATVNEIPGANVQIIGLARGNVAYSKHLGRDIMAGFKNLAGGEIQSYTDMVNEARTIAEDRMVEQAKLMGADAVMGVRFQTCAVSQGTIEAIAYGTAVKLV